MPSTPWKKSPPDLAERFDAALPSVAGLERRSMFGYPSAFLDGNLFCGLFQDRVVARVGAARAASLAAAAQAEPFEPMAGRAMREYVLVPASDAGSVETLVPWLREALAFVRTVPPKAGRAGAAAKTGGPAKAASAASERAVVRRRSGARPASGATRTGRGRKGQDAD